MAVNIFNNSISGCYIGNGVVSAIYQGDEKLYPISFKLKITNNSGNTYNTDCNDSSTLTNAEVLADVQYMWKIKEIEIGSCVETVDKDAFNGNSYITKFIMNDSVKYLKEQSCMLHADSTDPNLDNFKISSGLTIVETNGLNGYFAIDTLKLPNLESVGDWFLWDSYNIVNLEIGDKITSIGINFLNMNSLSSVYHGKLKSVTIKAIIPPTLGSYAFSRAFAADGVIYVPSESVELYKTATNWSQFADKIQPIT